MCNNCLTATPTTTGERSANLDSKRAEAFAEQMMDTMNKAALSFMLSIGFRTRLFDTMADLPPSTSQQIADAAGLNERYVREWLGAMVTGRIVEHDPQAGTYRLPPEHATFTTRAAGANNFAQTMQWFAVLGSVEDRIVEAFKHGGGVPYEAYERFHSVMADESELTVVSGLIEHVLPLAPGLDEHLQRGVEVLDVGCGSGRAIIRLAEHFPASRFTGYDISEEAISAARRDAEQRGLTNVHFAVQDVAEIDDVERFDLITAFDAIHDQAKPDVVLANISRALRRDGRFLMQDIKAQTPHHENLDMPLAPLIYTISCMHCMTVSLAQGGMGLGAAWGRQKALEMLAEAGFTDVAVEELPHDIMNYWYLARKA